MALRLIMHALSAACELQFIFFLDSQIETFNAFR
jgi:hypothetical protein